MYLIANGGVHNLKNAKEAILLSKFDSSCDGVLVDVRMTRDKKLVLYENDLIFNNYYISQMDYDDIKKISLGLPSWRNYYIPLLEDILSNYEKELLVIKLHHNYDQNELLVQELKRILEKYLLKKVVIVTDNDNLYEYLKLDFNYEVYFENNSNNFWYIDVFVVNYNNEIKPKFIVSKGSFDECCNNKKYIDNEKSDNIFIVTNNSRTLRKYNLEKLIFDN